MIYKRLGCSRMGPIGDDDFRPGQARLYGFHGLSIEPVTITFPPSEWNSCAVAAQHP
jgi:hypothetical protein